MLPVVIYYFLLLSSSNDPLIGRKLKFYNPYDLNGPILDTVTSYPIKISRKIGVSSPIKTIRIEVWRVLAYAFVLLKNRDASNNDKCAEIVEKLKIF